jgi:hypothetical protein
MQRYAALLAALALVTMGAPAASTADDAREENREFLLQYWEDYDPDEVVEVQVNAQTQTMTQEEALDHALDLAEDRDLETIANAAVPADHDSRDWVGDLFHLALGGADCGTQSVITEQGSALGADADPQFELHEGPVLYTTGASADRLNVVHSATMKEGHTVDEVSWTGKARSFCIPGFLALDSIDGIATNDGLPGAVHDL